MSSESIREVLWLEQESKGTVGGAEARNGRVTGKIRQALRPWKGLWLLLWMWEQVLKGEIMLLVACKFRFKCIAQSNCLLGVYADCHRSPALKRRTDDWSILMEKAHLFLWLSQSWFLNSVPSLAVITANLIFNALRKWGTKAVLWSYVLWQNFGGCLDLCIVYPFSLFCWSERRGQLWRSVFCSPLWWVSIIGFWFF